MYADVGSNGRTNDSGVWNNSDQRDKIETRELGLPDAVPLPHGSIKMPYVFLGDDAFALKMYMMKPYSQRELTVEKRIYNYLHSRARRISENLFGILANRWRVFHSILNLGPEKVTAITTCTLVLPNFLRKGASRKIYSPPTLADYDNGHDDVVNGTWRSDTNPAAFLPIEPVVHVNNPRRSAKVVLNSNGKMLKILFHFINAITLLCLLFVT